MQHTCSSAFEGTMSWCCQQKKWSHSPPPQLSVLPVLPLAFCLCGCWSKSSSTNSCSATKPAPVPPSCCAQGVSAEEGAGRDGWLGRDLSSSIGLELLQKPLMLHPQASSHHPPTAVTTRPELPERTLKRREGHMDQLGFPGAQDHVGDGSDFLPGPGELKGWAPYPSEQDESPASIANNNNNVWKPLHRTSLHCRRVSSSLSSTKKTPSMIFPLLFLSGLCLTGTKLE